MTRLPYMHLAHGDLEREIATTRRMLKRAPEEKYAWKPHEKSMSLGDLVSHLAHLLWWGTTTLTTDELDMAGPFPRRTAPENRAALLDEFDRKADELRHAVGGLAEEDLARMWTLRVGSHVIFSEPKADVFRSFTISHMAHHRGQLSVYLRLLNVSVPPSYGPTADEDS